MATQGLNFQTHQFNDPTEGLQKALGAGSMFAQSLKSMQDFESEQAKLRMMQQEKDRQAKIDFEASQEKAKNIAASAALNDKSVKMDFGNEMYRGVTDQEKNAMTAKSDAELGIKSLSYADMLKGVDTSKWDKDQLAERDQWLAADSDKTAKYTAGNKLAVQKRLNMLNGMGNDEAEKAAAAALGLKDDQAKSILAGDTLQETFGQRVLETANSPLYMQSDAQALRDFKKKYGTTAQIEASIGSADKAESMARKELHDQIALKQQQIQAGISKADEAVLNREIQMMQLQMQNIGSPLERASYKESSGSGSKKVYDEDMSAVEARLLAKYEGVEDPAFRQNLAASIAQAKQKGLLPNAVEAEIRRRLVPVGEKEEGKAQQFKLDSTTISNMTADKDAFARLYGGGSSSSEASYYAQAMQEKQGVIDKINALQGKKGKGAAGEVAVLQKQLAELERTPMQSAKDAAYQAGLDFAKDYNIGGYGDKQAAAATLQQTLANSGSSSGTGAAGTKVGTASIKGKNAGIAIAKALIDEGEGTGYKVYSDFKTVNGKKVERLATSGGIGINDDDGINKQILDYNKKNGTRISVLKKGDIPNPAQQKFIDDAKASHLNKTYEVASKLTGDLGNDNTTAAVSGAIANMLWQYGDHSKPATKLANSIITSLKKNNPNEAIKTIMNSNYSDFDEKRAIAFAQSIAKSYPDATVDPVSMARKYDTKSAAKRYNSIYSQLKKSDLDESDQSYMLSKLQERFGNDKISGLRYKVDPLGISSTNIMPTVSTPQNLQNVYAERVASPATHDYRSYMSQAELAKVSDPNTRSVDRWSINSDAKSRMNIAEVQNKARSIQMEARNEQIAGDLVTKHGLANQYKNATTESQRKLIENTAKLMEADAINAARGQMLKAGLFH